MNPYQPPSDDESQLDRIERRFELHHGDCLDVLKTLADCSVDAIVTDPPYGISFMGKRWDYDVPTEAVWVECLRVLKPGGHLLAFAGTRTQHRMAVRIEDAGFEIRDMIAWVYGSGFPKSFDVSKAIDKMAGHWRGKAGEVVSDNGAMSGGNYERNPKGEPVTDEATTWNGFGTALKPALEPITLARKPLIGTVAANVLEHGTGGLNIDGCRVGDTVETWPKSRSYAPGQMQPGHSGDTQKTGSAPEGRFPANFIHDGSEEVLALFPDSKSCSSPSNARPEGTILGGARSQGAIYPGETGSAARFFYCAKASKDDRDEGCGELEAGVLARSCQAQAEAKRGNVVECEEGAYNKARLAKNNHPTVKPTDLMRYLCRLVTPPGGIVLDPFTGSGSTGKAAMAEGFRFIGIEREAEYVEIARARISAEAEKPRQLSLF